MAVLGLRFCARAFSSCGKRGSLFIAVHGPLTIAASLVAEHRLQTRRLSSCGSRTQPLRGMWDLPRPGLEPVSPALAGRFPTTVPPGKPLSSKLFQKKKKALKNHPSSIRIGTQKAGLRRKHVAWMGLVALTDFRCSEIWIRILRPTLFHHSLHPFSLFPLNYLLT